MRRLFISLLGFVVITMPALARSAASPGASALASHSLVMPFDASPGRVSYLVARRADADDSRATVATHWTFWQQGGAYLGDRWDCLTPGQTAIVDPGSGPALSGKRGLVVATAYAADRECPPSAPSKPIDGVLAGAVSIADPMTGAVFGHDAFTVALDARGSFADLPDAAVLHPTREGTAIVHVDVPTFAPRILGHSTIIVLALRERAGPESHPDELGPLDEVRGASRLVSPEASGALRVVELDGAWFSSLLGEDGALNADDASSSRAGVFRITDLVAGESRIGDHDGIDGNDSWIFALHGQGVGAFGVGFGATLATGAPAPIVTPSPSVRPTPTPSAVVPSATPATTASAAPTVTPISPPTPAATSTPRPQPTATNQAPTPTSPATPVRPTSTPSTPAPTRTPVATPRPTSTARPTQRPTMTANPSCERLRVAASVAWSSSEFAAGVTLDVVYPSQDLVLPGTGDEASVRERIDNLSGTRAIVAVNDREDEISIGMVLASGEIKPGPIAAVNFDCGTGRPRPTLADFTCTADAAMADGAPLAASCALLLE